jgi:hypothetical protein
MVEKVAFSPSHYSCHSAQKKGLNDLIFPFLGKGLILRCLAFPPLV